MKSYEAIYRAYTHPNPKTNWSSDENIRENLVSVNYLDDSPLSKGGLPIVSDGKKALVDASDSHCIVYGASGFKKSICVFMPLICTLAKAGENMFITDPKGELYARTANYLKHLGYKIRVLNFRDYNGEGYNPLSYPTKLYRSGEIDKATSVSSNLVAALAQEQFENSKVDVFWPNTAMAANNGILPIMYSSYPNPDTVNFISLADYYTNRTAGYLNEYVNQESELANAAMQNLRTVLSEPEKTLMSTLSTCSSFIQKFIQNDHLARMLSHSTFELDELSEEKTAIYVITDDSSTVCDPIIGTLISQIQNLLVEKAFHSKGGKLSTRVNFVLDEFCSFPIPDIATALATHRSRNIRYYLCCQSIDLLKKRYPNYKNMMTNCTTTLFLGSTELELLEEISRRCGTTEITMSGHEEPLISVPELMTLRKDWYSKEAIYLNLSSDIRYCTSLPSIEKYETFCTYGEAELPDMTHPPVCFYSFVDLMSDVSIGKANKPFCPQSKLKSKTEAARKKSQRKKSDKASEDILDEDIRKELEEKFNELFDILEDEEDS